MTLKTLQKINELLAQASLGQNDQAVAGVLRGGGPIRKGRQWLDLRNTVLLLGELEFPVGWVSTRTNAFLASFNTVSFRTSLRRIAGLYRDFVVTHPFVEANGRTGHVLLDGMVLKAGLPPVPQNLQTRMVIYKTVDEVYRDLLRAYAAAQ